jgi:hypothetical protein
LQEVLRLEEAAIIRYMFQESPCAQAISPSGKWAWLLDSSPGGLEQEQLQGTENLRVLGTVCWLSQEGQLTLGVKWEQ